jgi:hypothetical protein
LDAGGEFFPWDGEGDLLLLLLLPFFFAPEADNGGFEFFAGVATGVTMTVTEFVDDFD